MLFVKYYQDDQIKDDEMGRACSVQEEHENVYEILVGKPEGRRSLGRHRTRWEDNIKMHLKEIK